MPKPSARMSLVQKRTFATVHKQSRSRETENACVHEWSRDPGGGTSLHVLASDCDAVLTSQWVRVTGCLHARMRMVRWSVLEVMPVGIISGIY